MGKREEGKEKVEGEQSEVNRKEEEKTKEITLE